MKKWMKITLGVIGGIVLLLIVDLGCIFTINRPLFAIKKDNGSVYKGILYDTYSCAEYSVPQIKAKGTKFICHDVPQKEREPIEFYDQELVQCLESELGGYLVTEKDNLVKIPLSKIKKDNHGKIEYYKGVYASEHTDNMYVMVYPKNGTYDSAVMKDFDKYFYEKFSVYQKYESSNTPTIYIHNNDNDVDFKKITNKCITKKNTNDGKSMPTETLNKINDTIKIIIKSGQEELGKITDKEKLTEILSAVSSSKRYDEVCNSDGYRYEFDMYDKNNKLIDTLYIWGDGVRLISKSLNGCPYVITNNTDLRKTIEDTTDYTFYEILDFRDDINQTKQTLVYKDGKNSYYLYSKDSNEILIKFLLNNKVMTLQYALENKYIPAERVVTDYKDILIKKESLN